MATSFEWDENKNRANRRKHGISFELAVRVFADESAIVRQDRSLDGEERWQAIGSADGGFLVLLVAHTMAEAGHDLLIRIISARKATPKERRLYEENDRED